MWVVLGTSRTSGRSGRVVTLSSFSNLLLVLPTFFCTEPSCTNGTEHWQTSLEARGKLSTVYTATWLPGHSNTAAIAC